MKDFFENGISAPCVARFQAKIGKFLELEIDFFDVKKTLLLVGFSDISGWMID